MEINKSPAASGHDQHQLEKQREATDAAARASALRQLGPSATPGATPTVRALMPALYRGEVYAGLCQDPGLGPLHLILLPGDVRVGSIEDAEEFVASMGGELPTYAELGYLHMRMGQQFKASLYCTCEQEEYDGDTVPVVYDFATDLERIAQNGARCIRVRAVRRVLADVAGGPSADLNVQQVAALAEQLIDQHAVADGEESIERARMVGTGIMVGIRLMATEVQKALSARQRQDGGGVRG